MSVTLPPIVHADEIDATACPWCGSDACEDAAHVGRPMTAADIDWARATQADDPTARIRALALDALALADDADLIDAVVALADLALDGVAHQRLAQMALAELADVTRDRDRLRDQRRAETIAQRRAA